ncbi:hypothetical protein DFH09DRAFT_1075383 [Mycena vulgaris]|nr:hypothetical protein DFH09DRAFT_1075383 [Mycena vulgaris]
MVRGAKYPNDEIGPGEILLIKLFPSVLRGTIPRTIYYMSQHLALTEHRCEFGGYSRSESRVVFERVELNDGDEGDKLYLLAALTSKGGPFERPQRRLQDPRWTLIGMRRQGADLRPTELSRGPPSLDVLVWYLGQVEFLPTSFSDLVQSLERTIINGSKASPSKEGHFPASSSRWTYHMGAQFRYVLTGEGIASIRGSGVELGKYTPPKQWDDSKEPMVIAGQRSIRWAVAIEATNHCTPLSRNSIDACNKEQGLKNGTYGRAGILMTSASRSSEQRGSPSCPVTLSDAGRGQRQRTARWELCWETETVKDGRLVGILVASGKTDLQIRYSSSNRKQDGRLTAEHSFRTAIGFQMKQEPFMVFMGEPSENFNNEGCPQG